MNGEAAIVQEVAKRKASMKWWEAIDEKITAHDRKMQERGGAGSGR